MSMAKKEFYKVFQGFVLSKGSPLKSVFDKKYAAYLSLRLRIKTICHAKCHAKKNRILQMQQSGLTNYWQKKLWPSVHACDSTLRKNGPRSLNLDDIQSPFMIWGIGAALSIFTFVAEHLFSISVKFLFRTVT